MKALGNDFFGVIRAATGLRTFKASHNTDCFRCVEVEDVLALGNSLLEFFSLVNGTGETVNKVVLTTVIRNDGYGVIIFKLRNLLWRVWR